jgi:hypothetical protein
MIEETQRLIQRQLRSPRSAAIAGILYSILMITGMILASSIVRAKPEDITGDWLETRSGTASLVLTLVPFAGIAFL